MNFILSTQQTRSRQSAGRARPADNARFNRVKHSDFCGCCKQTRTDGSTTSSARGASSQKFLRVKRKNETENQKNQIVKPQLKTFSSIQQQLRELEQKSSRLLQQICSARESPCQAQSQLQCHQASAVCFRSRQTKRRDEFQMSKFELEQTSKKIDRIISNRFDEDQLQRTQALKRTAALRFIKSDNLLVKKPLKICSRNTKLLIVEKGYDKYIKKSKAKPCQPQKANDVVWHKKTIKKSKKSDRKSAENSQEREVLPVLKKVRSQELRPNFARCQIVREPSQPSSDQRIVRREEGSQTFLSVDLTHQSSQFHSYEQVKVSKRRLNKYQYQREVQTRLTMSNFHKEFTYPQESRIFLCSFKEPRPSAKTSFLTAELSQTLRQRETKQDRLAKLKFQANLTTTVHPHRLQREQDQTQQNQFIVDLKLKEKSEPRQSRDIKERKGKMQQRTGKEQEIAKVVQKDKRDTRKSHTFSFSDYVQQTQQVSSQTQLSPKRQVQTITPLLETPIKKVSFNSSHFEDFQSLNGSVSQLSLNRCQDRVISRLGSNIKSMASICEDQQGYSYASVRSLLVRVPAQSEMGLQTHRLIGQSGQRLESNWAEQIQNWQNHQFRVTLQICAYLGEGILTRLFENQLRLLADGSIFCYLSHHGLWKLLATRGESLTKCLFSGLSQLRGSAEWGVPQYLKSVLNSPCKCLEISAQWQKIKKILSDLRQRSQSLIREEFVFAVLKRRRAGNSLYLIQYSEKIDSSEQEQLLIRLTGQASSFFMKSKDFSSQFQSVIIINTSKDYFHDNLQIPKGDETNLKVYAGGLSVREGGNGVFSLQQNGVEGSFNKISLLLYYEVEKHKYEFKGKISSTKEIFFLKFFQGGNYLFFVDGLSRDLRYSVTFCCTQRPRLKHCKWLQSSRLGFQDLELLFMPLSQEQPDKKEKSSKLKSRVRLN